MSVDDLRGQYDVAVVGAGPAGLAAATVTAKAGLGTALGHGAWTFVKTYLLRAGFLDGREGFMLAVSNAEGAYYKYLKLMLMARPDTHAE